MQQLLDGFVLSLMGEQEKSGNTILSYKRDVADYLDFLAEKKITDIKKSNRTTVLTYLLHLRQQGRAMATISRRMASLRSFYSYVISSGVSMNDPTANLETPKVVRKAPSILTTEETALLLSMPKSNDLKGCRDKAMLELLYATGIKVSELISLGVDDVDLMQSCIILRAASRRRIVPIGRKAVGALSDYLTYARPLMIGDELVKNLFVNCSGTPLSRQGFWKILKHYRKEAGIEKDITPYTLRHSFAIHLMENGADIKIISQMLGHTDVSAMQMYSDIMDSGVRAVYEKAHPRA